LRLLVTGISGHVGGAIATHMLNCGWEVLGLSRSPSKLKGLAQEIQADISSPGVLKQVSSTVKPCDAIVHAAASLDKDLFSPAVSLTNCLGTQQVLWLADKWSVKSFIFISSVPVIGLPQLIPITEEHPTQPLTAYHASKFYGECLVRLAGLKCISGVTLRITSPVGPGMPGNRIFAIFVKRALENQPLQLLGQGTRRQNYVDVRDIAMAVELCLQQRITGIFNIGGKKSISNYDLAQLCISVLGSSSVLTFADRADPEEGVFWDVSIDKAASRFAYAPQHGLEESIRTLSIEYATGSHQ
jgi:nucleoside-diphosphate-sugar epimerase